ncbi:MAG: VanZ family protein [Acidimicrobiia bacterium]
MACALYLGLATRLPIVGDVDASTWAKWGHVVATMFLAALVYLMLVDAGRTRRDAAVITLVVAAGAGALLEVLQAIGGVRDPSIVDVLYDTLGAVVAVGLLSLPLLSLRAWSNVVTVAVVAMIVVVVPAALFATPGDETLACDLLRVPVEAAAASDPGATVPTPIARYDFDAGSGTVAADMSGAAPALDLQLSRAGVSWIEGGGPHFDGGVARSAESAASIAKATKRSGAITVEAWVRTDRLDQTGPARLVSISDGTQYHDVNVHLGQDADALSVRLRTSCGDFTAPTIPNVFTSRTTAEHVAVTFADGIERVYVGGKNVAAWRLEGRLAGWDPTFPLVVGNEATLDRPFDGDVFAVAIYHQALSGSAITGLARPPHP